MSDQLSNYEVVRRETVTRDVAYTVLAGSEEEARLMVVEGETHGVYREGPDDETIESAKVVSVTKLD